MAVGKSKASGKSLKKGGKKKTVDPFTRKEWYNVKAPVVFTVRNIGKTLVNRTQGLKTSSDALKGRVYEVSLADLQKEQSGERSYRKFKLICEHVHGRDCLTNFHGMDLTTDKLRGLVKRWQTLIEAVVDVKTVDGYLLRVFCIGFTKKQSSIKKTAYAQHSQVRNIRKMMTNIITKEVSSVDLLHLVQKLIPDSIARDVEKFCSFIYPLGDVYIRKVKVLRKPRLDLNKLMEIHNDEKQDKAAAAESSRLAADMEVGEAVQGPDYTEPPVQEYV